MSATHHFAAWLAAAPLMFPSGAGAKDRIDCSVEARLHRVDGQDVMPYPNDPGQPALRRGLAQVEITVLTATAKAAHRQADREHCARLGGRRDTLKVGWEDPKRNVIFDPAAPLRLDYTWYDLEVTAPFERWELPPEPGTWIPPFLDEITDLAKVLSPEQWHPLRRELSAASNARIWVLTVPSLDGEAIASFSRRVAGAWNVQQGGHDWQILLTLAVAERAAHVEVGKNLVDLIPEQQAQEIIDQEMAPAFRQGDYAAGLARGVRALLEAANPGSSFVECAVKAKILSLDKRSPVTLEIAQTLGLPEETIGVLAVALVAIDVLDAERRRGSKESCEAMVGKTGKVVVRYGAGTAEPRFAAGEILDLDYFGYAGFPPYGVPGREAWTLRQD